MTNGINNQIDNIINALRSDNLDFTAAELEDVGNNLEETTGKLSDLIQYLNSHQDLNQRERFILEHLKIVYKELYS